jgi:hypothetical protein
MTTFTATKCLTPESNSEHVVQWLNEYRFSQYVHIFENFSGELNLSAVVRLSTERFHEDKNERILWKIVELREQYP